MLRPMARLVTSSRAWRAIPLALGLIALLLACNVVHLKRCGLRRDFARASMVGLTMAALIIANVPGMKILYLFLFYGTLRASTWLPTMRALSGRKVAEPAIFWGILAAIAVGLPVFAAGNFQDRPALALTGSLLTVLLSGGFVLLWPPAASTRDTATTEDRV